MHMYLFPVVVGAASIGGVKILKIQLSNKILIQVECRTDFREIFNSISSGGWC